MFLTAQTFKLHNIGQHKTAALRHAADCYHETVRLSLLQAAADPGLFERAKYTDKNGKLHTTGYGFDREIRKILPQGISISPIRDYAVTNVANMLLSFSKLKENGHDVNLPTLPELRAKTDAEVEQELRSLVDAPLAPLTAEQEERLKGLNPMRVERMRTAWRRRALQKKTDAILRSKAKPLPLPVEFTHYLTNTKFGKGFLLAERHGRYYFLCRIFSKGHRYCKQYILENSFFDTNTGESIGGQKFTGFVLPLEIGRDYHDKKFLMEGKPRSAKLFVRRSDNGIEEIFVNISFEFNPAPIETAAFIGLDRGAAIIGAATVIDTEANVLSRLALEGKGFAAEMAAYSERIAEAQRKGKRAFKFGLRKRTADNVIGEFANKLVEEALKYRARVVIEALDGKSFGRFLRQSQVTKLKQKLDYKLERVGLPPCMEVPAAYTSQTCTRCGHKAKENRLEQEAFRCVRCGYAENADVNASEVIALRGLHQVKVSDGKKFRYQKFDTFQVWLQSQKGAEPLATVG